MRKILFALVMILLLILTGFTIYSGTNIGRFDIWGVKQISEKNEEIDQANSDLSTLVSVTYPATLSKLSNSSETLQETKKEYEDQPILLADSKYYKQTEKYKIEFLWTRIGNYAKDNNVVLDLKIATTGTNEIYNLNFTVTGIYSAVTDFIYDIENDSRLGFKIEDFKMSSASNENNNVQGSFSCKDIRIDIKSIDADTTEQSTNNTNNTNNTKDTTTTENTTSEPATNTQSTPNTETVDINTSGAQQ